MEDDGIVNEKTNPNGTIDNRSRYAELCRLSSKFLADRVLDCLSNREPHPIGIPDNGQVYIGLTTSEHSTASNLENVFKYCKSHYNKLINSIFHELYDKNCLKIKSDINVWGRKIIAFYLDRNLDLGRCLKWCDFPIIIIKGLIFTEKETYLNHDLEEEYYLKDHSANIRRAKSDAFRKNLHKPNLPK